MDVQVAFVAVPVSALPPSRRFYEDVFGRSPDIVPNEHEAMWRLTDTAWLYVVSDAGHAERAGHTTATLSVADLDRALDELASRGITPELVEAVGSAGRKATVRDPDGNTVALIEVR
ncbi:MAG TPA: VOC family protein [Acidimicrobiales bacterium]|nr:VOC family protein [Acidimicrobiales bacterium]